MLMIVGNGKIRTTILVKWTRCFINIVVGIFRVFKRGRDEMVISTQDEVTIADRSSTTN